MSFGGRTCLILAILHVVLEDLTFLRTVLRLVALFAVAEAGRPRLALILSRFFFYLFPYQKALKRTRL